LVRRRPPEVADRGFPPRRRFHLLRRGRPRGVNARGAVFMLAPGEFAMQDSGGNIDGLVNTVETMVKGCHESGTFAGGLCGPSSLLSQVTGAVLEGQPGVAAVQRFQACLETLDRLVASAKMPAVYRQDATIPGRWAGLSQLVRSRLVAKSSADS